jgi:hypothetical protein
MALIDTGCNQSVMSLGTFKKMKKQTYDSLELQPKNLMAATMANGQKMEFIEGIKLKFQTCKTDIRIHMFALNLAMNKFWEQTSYFKINETLILRGRRLSIYKTLHLLFPDQPNYQ